MSFHAVRACLLCGLDLSGAGSSPRRGWMKLPGWCCPGQAPNQTALSAIIPPFLNI